MKKFVFILFTQLCIGVCVAKAQFLGVRINMLEIATGTLNVGLEVAIAKKWSLDFPIHFNPINANNYSSRCWYFQPGVRYWIYEHFVGHFTATHFAFGRYNIGNKKFNHKGSIAGIGFSYGYTWILKKRLNLTAECGIGVFYLRRSKYNREYDVWQPKFSYEYHQVVLGPSKAEVSLTYLF